MNMIINDLLDKKGMSSYMLGIQANIPQSTISDICSGKVDLNNCKAGTLYKIANALDVSCDYILKEFNKKDKNIRLDFDLYRSNVCHELKDKGRYQFILDVIEEDRIRSFYKKKWYPEAFYLLALIDYLCRLENFGIVTEYEDIRKQKLDRVIYPGSVIVMYNILKDEKIKRNAIKGSIPEFIKFNIVEGDVFNVA